MHDAAAELGTALGGADHGHRCGLQDAADREARWDGAGGRIHVRAHQLKADMPSISRPMMSRLMPPVPSIADSIAASRQHLSTSASTAVPCAPMHSIAAWQTASAVSTAKTLA